MVIEINSNNMKTIITKVILQTPRRVTPSYLNQNIGRIGANIYYSEMEMYAKIVTDEVFIMEAISA